MKTPEIRRIVNVAKKLGLCDNLINTLSAWLLEGETESRLESFAKQNNSFTELIDCIGREFLHHMTVMRFKMITP